MAEISARSKFSCPACGAEAQWNPAKQALVCPFCGTVAPMKTPPGGGAIEEHDLVTALRSIPDDQRGWQAEKKSVKCQSCQAITVFDPDSCGPALRFLRFVGADSNRGHQGADPPESLLEFKIPESQVRDHVRAWYGNVWFAPNALKSRALTDTVRGIYLPYWTFDAKVHADWTAESGYYYYETEYYTDSDGKQQSREVQRTRWEPSSGSLDHFFDDELVPASKGVPAPLLRKIEPFPDDHRLKAYDPGFLSGWVVEQYQIDLVAAAQNAREMMDRETQQLCGQQVPGDTYRALQVNPDYSGQTFKHILVPVWVLAYTFGAQTFQVVINGYTARLRANIR